MMQKTSNKELLLITIPLLLVAFFLLVTKTSLIAVVTGPKIYDMAFTKLSNSSVDIAFRTTKPVSAKLKYGTSEMYGVETSMSASSVSHDFQLTGLLPGKEHDFVVVMRDGSGREIVSDNYVLKPL